MSSVVQEVAEKQWLNQYSISFSGIEGPLLCYLPCFAVRPSFLSCLMEGRDLPSCKTGSLKEGMDVPTMQILFVSNIFPFTDIKRMAYIVGILVRQGQSACDTLFPSSGYPP
jgi:hypothetical protein